MVPVLTLRVTPAAGVCRVVIDHDPADRDAALELLRRATAGISVIDRDTRQHGKAGLDPRPRRADAPAPPARVKEGAAAR